MIYEVARLIQSMIMPNVRPIFVVVRDVITYMNRQIIEPVIEETDNEILATAIRTLMEDEVVKIVSATKSSIDMLEKVKIKLNDRCLIYLEEFIGEVDEVARMSC